MKYTNTGSLNDTFWMGSVSLKKKVSEISQKDF
jgi:hypothetical protein